MVSPEAALLTASRNVGQSLAEQVALSSEDASSAPVTVQVVAACAGNAASPIPDEAAKTTSERSMACIELLQPEANCKHKR
jgi:hypothetical protein